MGLWKSLSSCLGFNWQIPSSSNDPIPTAKKSPVNSYSTSSSYNPSHQSMNEKSSANPPLDLAKPIQPTTKAGETAHAKLPSHARTSKSFKIAAKKPRAVHLSLGIDVETEFGGFDDPCKKWYRDTHCTAGRVWDVRMEANYEEWMAAVTRGRGCT